MNWIRACDPSSVAGECPGEHRLAGAREVLDEQVPLGDQARQGEPDDVALAKDGALDVLRHRLEGVAEPLHALGARRHGGHRRGVGSSVNGRSSETKLASTVIGCRTSTARERALSVSASLGREVAGVLVDLDPGAHARRGRARGGTGWRRRCWPTRNACTGQAAEVASCTAPAGSRTIASLCPPYAAKSVGHAGEERVGLALRRSASPTADRPARASCGRPRPPWCSPRVPMP